MDVFKIIGIPKSSKSWDHFRIETHGDLVVPHFRKPHVYIYIYPLHSSYFIQHIYISLLFLQLWLLQLLLALLLSFVYVLYYINMHFVSASWAFWYFVYCAVFLCFLHCLWGAAACHSKTASVIFIHDLLTIQCLSSKWPPKNERRVMIDFIHIPQNA